jgi:hypothetical protein
VKTPTRKTLSVLTCCIVLMLTSSACATRVVYVKNGTPVRLAEPVKAKVWIVDSSGKEVMSQNKILIPEGWYALPK